MSGIPHHPVLPAVPTWTLPLRCPLLMATTLVADGTPADATLHLLLLACLIYNIGHVGPMDMPGPWP